MGSIGKQTWSQLFASQKLKTRESEARGRFLVLRNFKRMQNIAFYQKDGLCVVGTKRMPVWC